MMDARLLLVDDDVNLTNMLGEILVGLGYQVASAANGRDALRQLHHWRPELVVLDLLMPDMDGWETCRRIREVSDVPVLMLTAKTGEINELRALNEGVDMFMTKPFSVQLFLARVESLLRRSRSTFRAQEQSILRVGDLEIDLWKHTVALAGAPVDLSPTEFRLLSALASRAGRVVSHHELLSEVWGPDYADQDPYLKLYIRYLREKLEADPARPSHILTRRGMGYYLNDAPSVGLPRS
jgi:two-component system KDP operon response regulator KdpE